MGGASHLCLLLRVIPTIIYYPSYSCYSDYSYSMLTP